MITCAPAALCWRTSALSGAIFATTTLVGIGAPLASAPRIGDVKVLMTSTPGMALSDCSRASAAKGARPATALGAIRYRPVREVIELSPRGALGAPARV